MILLRFAPWAYAAPIHLAWTCALAVAFAFTSFIGTLTLLRAAWRRIRARLAPRTLPVRDEPTAPPSTSGAPRAAQEQLVVELAEGIVAREAWDRLIATGLDPREEKSPSRLHAPTETDGESDD